MAVCGIKAIPEALTIPERWLFWAKNKPDADAIIHVDEQMNRIRISWGRLLQRAVCFQRFLTEQGVQAGDTCGLLIRHHPDFYSLYMGVVLCGAVPCVLAYPNKKLHPDKFIDGIRGISRKSGLSHLLTEKDLADYLQNAVEGGHSAFTSVLLPFVGVSAVDEITLANYQIRGGTGKDVFLVQHSSGTTGLQKPIEFSGEAIHHHLLAYGSSIGVCDSDKVVSWLPYYHDMGLIAVFHLAMFYGLPLVQMSPIDWVASPGLLIDLIDSEQATLMWLPNFAHTLLAKRVRSESITGKSLTSLRLVTNCSEPISAESRRLFIERFAVEERVLGCSYAMAETVFAVTQTPLGTCPKLLAERNGAFFPYEYGVPLADDRDKIHVSSGQVLNGVEVEIVDAEMNPVPEGMTGEIAIRSQTMFCGYRNDPEKTASVFRNGWYFSGDIGFIHHRELYVVGRKKDLIIHAGKNIHPIDLEELLGEVPGVTPGRVCVFGLYSETCGTEEIYVIVETEESDQQKLDQLQLSILTLANERGCAFRRIFFVEPRWLIKSSSGKIARVHNKQRAVERFLQ